MGYLPSDTTSRGPPSASLRSRKLETAKLSCDRRALRQGLGPILWPLLMRASMYSKKDICEHVQTLPRHTHYIFSLKTRLIPWTKYIWYALCAEKGWFANASSRCGNAAMKANHVNPVLGHNRIRSGVEGLKPQQFHQVERCRLWCTD